MPVLMFVNVNINVSFTDNSAEFLRNNDEQRRKMYVECEYATNCIAGPLRTVSIHGDRRRTAGERSCHVTVSRKLVQRQNVVEKPR